jgi:hypothetical protein
MAADLTADIEEAESEGGTAEDVLGNSAFDPRRFAGSWAVARGVTAPPVPTPGRRRWPALAVGLTGGAALLFLAGTVLLGRRQSAEAISSVRRNLPLPRSVHVFPGPSFLVQRVQHFDGFGLFAFLLLVVGLIGIGLAVLYWAPWSASRRIGPWEIRRHRTHSGDPRT